MTPEVAILVPHFQTPTLTAHCLERLFKYTHPSDYQIVLIDNGSRDGSGEWLQQRFPQTHLVRRELEPGERAAAAHGRALDLGLQATSAPFLVTVHTDTMVLHRDWLACLMEPMLAGGSNVAAVGAEKRAIPAWRIPGKWIEDGIRGLLTGRPPTRRFPRSYFSVYRREWLDGEVGFTPVGDRSPGEDLAVRLHHRGGRIILLDSNRVLRYVLHLNHATLALNDEIGAGDPYVHRTRRRALDRVRRFLARTPKSLAPSDEPSTAPAEPLLGPLLGSQNR